MSKFLRSSIIVAALAVAAALAPRGISAQEFNFDALRKQIQDYTVIIKMKIEISFGMQSAEQEQRLLGTIVSEDGRVLFDGTFLASDHTFSSLAGMSVQTTPKSIEIQTLDGKKYHGKYIGADRFTRLGFIQITDGGNTRFTPVKFATTQPFRIGQWVALYTLLPDFITPPVAADIGMVSTLIESPEKFPLTVGFNGGEIASVLFNEQLVPVGVLGSLMDPTAASSDAGGMLESFNQSDAPLFGVIGSDRLTKLITNPPKKGEADRSWLGISLQALTKDLGEFLHIPASGGIVVNDVVKGSPADKAKLKIGDIIYRMNDQPVDIDMDEKVAIFQRRISEMPAGTEVAFGVMRPIDSLNVDTLTVAAKLEPAPMSATNAPSYEDKMLEMKVRDLVFSDFMAHNLDPGSLKGVVVSDMKEGGLADVGNLQFGDIIQRIGSTDVSSAEEAKQALEKEEKKQPKEIVFFVWRDNKTVFINVKTQ